MNTILKKSLIKIFISYGPHAISYYMILMLPKSDSVNSFTDSFKKFSKLPLCPSGSFLRTVGFIFEKPNSLGFGEYEWGD